MLDTDEKFLKTARKLAACDGVIVAAHFCDMTYPALLNTFIEKMSVFNIMFIDDGVTCVGISKLKFMLYITKRGMNIKDNNKYDGACFSLKSLYLLWGIPKFECVSAYNLDYLNEKQIDHKLKLASNKAVKKLDELLSLQVRVDFLSYFVRISPAKKHMWGRTGFDRDVLGSNCSRVVTVKTKTKITDNSYMRVPRAQTYCAA